MLFARDFLRLKLLLFRGEVACGKRPLNDLMDTIIVFGELSFILHLSNDTLDVSLRVANNFLVEIEVLLEFDEGLNDLIILDSSLQDTLLVGVLGGLQFRDLIASQIKHICQLGLQLLKFILHLTLEVLLTLNLGEKGALTRLNGLQLRDQLDGTENFELFRRDVSFNLLPHGLSHNI